MNYDSLLMEKLSLIAHLQEKLHAMPGDECHQRGVSREKRLRRLIVQNYVEQ